MSIVLIIRNDCDEIRPELRNHLLKDSKMCQLEQVKDHQQRNEMNKDFDRAWHEIQCRDHHNGTQQDKTIARQRWYENQSVQSFLKEQMVDKVERGLKVWEEINEERKKFAEMSKEDCQLEQQRLRREQVVRQSIGEDVTVRSFSSSITIHINCFKLSVKFAKTSFHAKNNWSVS